MSTLIEWGPSTVFALLITGGFLLQAHASRQIGESPSVSVAYATALLLNPFFIMGIVLSFGSTFARQAMLVHSGANRTVLLSELSVVMMFVASIIVFREATGIRQYIGCTFILVGAVFVGAK